MDITLQPGTVTLVGGGPGDPDLITVAGLKAIRQADVVLYDRLAPAEVLDQAPAGAEHVPVGKVPQGSYVPQEEINRLLVAHARRGRRVVRLKGGDCFVFGRGGEEWQACAEAGVPVRVVPGVTSSTSGPALAGIPLTVTWCRASPWSRATSRRTTPAPRCPGASWPAAARRS